MHLFLTACADRMRLVMAASMNSDEEGIGFCFLLIAVLIDALNELGRVNRGGWIRAFGERVKHRFRAAQLCVLIVGCGLLPSLGMSGRIFRLCVRRKRRHAARQKGYGNSAGFDGPNFMWTHADRLLRL